VRFTEDPDATRAELLAAGFTICGEEDYIAVGEITDAFFAVRKGLLNIIVVWDYLAYIRWIGFSEVAAQIGTLDKVERITLAQAFRVSSPDAARNIVRTSAFNNAACDLARAQILRAL